MKQCRNQCIAIIFISLLAGNEAYLIQRNSATTRAAASMALIISAMGARMKMAPTELVDSFVNITQSEGSKESTQSYSCHSDVVLEYAGGPGKTGALTIRADQYRDAGEEGFMFALKTTNGLSCFESFAITCVAGQVSWRKARHSCLNMLAMRNDTVVVKPFGNVWDRWQEASISGDDEKIVASRYMPDFAFPVKSFSVKPAELDCPQLIREAEAAEKDVAGMLEGMCHDGGDPADQASTAGRCSTKTETTPAIDKYARALNSFMSAKMAVRSKGCASVGAAEMKTSPVMVAVKTLYTKIMSDKISPGEAPVVMDSAIDDLTEIAQKCGEGEQCMTSGPETSHLLAKLWYGPGSQQEVAEADSQAEEQADTTTFTVETLERMAAEVERGPEGAEKALLTKASSLLENGAEEKSDSAINYLHLFGWAAATAALLYFLFLVMTLVAAVLMFIAANIFTIAFVLFFGFVILVGLLTVVCGGVKRVSTETWACAGSRSHYNAKADRLGLPRYLVGRI